MFGTIQQLFFHGLGRWFVLSIGILLVGLILQAAAVKLRRPGLAKYLDRTTRVAMALCVVAVLANVVLDVAVTVFGNR